MPLYHFFCRTDNKQGGNILVLASNKKQAREILKETSYKEIESWQLTDSATIDAIMANSFAYCRFHIFKMTGFHHYNAYLPLQDVNKQKQGIGRGNDQLAI